MSITTDAVIMLTWKGHLFPVLGSGEEKRSCQSRGLAERGQEEEQENEQH